MRLILDQGIKQVVDSLASPCVGVKLSHAFSACLSSRSFHRKSCCVAFADAPLVMRRVSG